MQFTDVILQDFGVFQLTISKHFCLDVELPAGRVTSLCFKEQEAICLLSWRSAPVCLPFVWQLFTKHSKAISHDFRPSSKSLGLLPSFHSRPECAQAAPFWLKYGARLLHSINMPNCCSLFNQNINFSKTIFHHYKIFGIVFMMENSLVHYNLSL